ncbi:RrF2 family transcriptional regulator [Maribacter sp. 2308TA10-17]|uniref:RrF2 family transcriptional regulator n=1 Tax=Maribacter sp. 2308TA10-17 TaxID=3386276 RepID=UPI0039BD2234
MFSKACEYAIKASIYVASQSLEDKRVTLKDIAAEIDSPVAFTAKILQQLVRDDIMQSTMGPTGGFQIEKSRIDVIRLAEIVHAIDGDEIFTRCGLGLKQCNAKKPCPVHDKFSVIRDDLRRVVGNINLFELASGLYVGLTFIKR